MKYTPFSIEKDWWDESEAWNKTPKPLTEKAVRLQSILAGKKPKRYRGGEARKVQTAVDQLWKKLGL